MCSAVAKGKDIVSDDIFVRPDSEGRPSPSGLSVGFCPTDQVEFIGLARGDRVLPLDGVSDNNSEVIPLNVSDKCDGNDAVIQGIDVDDQTMGDDMGWSSYAENDDYLSFECDAGDGDAHFFSTEYCGPNNKYVIDHSIRDELCSDECFHLLSGCTVQLNRCAFYKELYMRGDVDVNADYLYSGVAHGFEIVDPGCDTSYVCKNYLSIEEPEFRNQMDEIISHELEQMKVSEVDSCPQCVHALGAVRKSSGKLRPITDCRRPLGRSINNFMTTTCGRFTYTTIDEICDSLNGGEFMAVIDIKSAYRSVNIFPKHRVYQGFSWCYQGIRKYFTDNCLCFGLRCAPFIFTQITEFLVRCMHKRGFDRVYGYIDDFLIVGSSREECAHGLDIFLELISELGFLIAREKLEFPSQVIKYLGIIIDTELCQLRLPEGKIEKVKEAIYRIRGKKCVCKRTLLSLAGLLSHCAKLVRGGRTFSRRVINLANSLPELHTIICLPEWFYDDLNWWQSFIDCFNGTVSFVEPYDRCETPVYTDSSLSGFGGLYGQDWFTGVWDISKHRNICRLPVSHIEIKPEELAVFSNINVLELWPVVCAARRWRCHWANKQILLRSDNSQVVRMVNTGRSKNIQCMAWLRELFWLSYIFNFQLIARHIRSDDNTMADMLSRCSSPEICEVTTSALVTQGCCCFCRSGQSCSTMVGDPVTLDGPEYIPYSLVTVEELF